MPSSSNGDLKTKEITGAYRQSGDSFSGTILGSDRSRGRFYCLLGGELTGEVQRVIVAQTPIYALAIGVMDDMPEMRTMYLSADGAIPMEYLQGVSHKRVILAMNRDEMGQRLAQSVRDELPHAQQVMPEQVDWVRDLQVEQTRSVQQQMQKGRSQLER